MITNTSISLNVLFQQCYDLTNLDPVKNTGACLSCFQGIYAAQDYSISCDDLAVSIFEVWGNLMNAEAFRTALLFFKKPDGSQAFTPETVALLVSKYYFKEIVVHFNYPGKISSIPRDYQFVEVGVAGAEGMLTKVVASTNLTDQGDGSSWGSDWRININRDTNKIAEALYVVDNPKHINPQYLRDVERVFEPPIKILSTDKVVLAATKWYPAHAATIVNTSFDLYISPLQSPAKLATPQDVAFSYDAGTGFTVGWAPVKGSDSYLIEIVSQKVKVSIAAIAGASANDTKVNIPLSSFTATNSPYIAMVKAMEETNKLESDFGESSQIVSKMAEVSTVNVMPDDTGTQYIVSWVAVAGSDSYTIQVLDLNNKNALPLSMEAGKDATSFPISISQIDGYSDNSNFQVRIRANGNAYVPGDFINTPNVIPQPVDLVNMDWKATGDKLLTFDSNTGLYWLSWKLWLDLSRNQMDNELNTNPAFAGFRYASMDELERLMWRASALYLQGRTAANIPGVRRLLLLLGANDFYSSPGDGNSSCAHFAAPGDFTLLTIETGDDPQTAKAGGTGSADKDYGGRLGHALVCSTKPQMP
jgi:hypothetical protein